MEVDFVDMVVDETEPDVNCFQTDEELVKAVEKWEFSLEIRREDGRKTHVENVIELTSVRLGPCPLVLDATDSDVHDDCPCRVESLSRPMTRQTVEDYSIWRGERHETNSLSRLRRPCRRPRSPDREEGWTPRTEGR